MRVDDADCRVLVGGNIYVRSNGGYGINATVATENVALQPNGISFLSNTSGDVDWTNIRPRPGQVIRATIADDAVYSFTPENSSGNSSGLLFVQEGAGSTLVGLGRFAAVSGGAEIASISSKANITWTTGALTGTTGTDGNLIISAHTDGKIYVENRRGGSRTVVLSLMAVGAATAPLG